MTPAAVLDKLLPRWRGALPAEYPSEFIDGFIQRNRTALEAVVARAMMLRRAKQGEPPTNPDEFAIFGKLAERERPKDQETDDQVFKRILDRREQMKARGRVTPEVAANHYIVDRATAILLRQSGWDVVPLLLREPALAVLVGVDVGAVVDVMGDLHLTAGFAEAERLRADIKAAQRRILDINTKLAPTHRVVDRQHGLGVTNEELGRYALAMWSLARESASMTGDREQILAAHRNLRDQYVNGEMPSSEYARRLAALRPGALAAGLTRDEMGRLGIPFHSPEEIAEATKSTGSRSEGRPEIEILEDMRDVQGALSPDTLHADGEASASRVRNKRRALQKKWTALVKELGREPTEDEMYPGPNNGRASKGDKSSRRATSKQRRAGTTPPMGAYQAGWAAALDAFNAGSHWRLARRQGTTTDTLIVFDEREDENTPVAVFVVVGFDIDQEQWTRSVGPAAEGEIRGRLERALWVASDTETASKEPRSPLEDLISHMRSRGEKLGASSASTLAEAREALAEPPSPGILIQWLRSVDLERTAESVEELFSREGDAASSLYSVESKIVRVWDSVSDELTILSATENGHELWVPDAAVHGPAETGLDALVLEYSFDTGRHGPSVRRRPVRLVQMVTDDDAEGGSRWLLQDKAGQIASRLYADDRTPEFYEELHRRLHLLEDDLTRSPRILSDVRELLYWSAALIDATRCQAETKRAAHAFFQSAFSRYTQACKDLARGSKLDQAAPIQQELRELSEAAAGLALSCGEGQLELSDARIMPERLPVKSPPVSPQRGDPFRPLPAGPKAVKWLHNLLTVQRGGWGITPVVNVGTHEYRDPVVRSHGNMVTVVFTDNQTTRTLTLMAMPLAGYAGRPHDGPVLLSGEIRFKRAIEASFSDRIVERAEIEKVTGKDLEKWFAAPESKTRTKGVADGLSSKMYDALAALRHEEHEKPWDIHPWPGVHEATRRALIERGLVIEIDNKHGGFPHYRTTKEGRALLTKPVAQASDRDVASARGPARAGVATPSPREARGTSSKDPASQQHGTVAEPGLAHARGVLLRAGIDVALRVVGRHGECHLPDAVAREQACSVLRKTGIHASIVRDRLFFPLRQQ